MHSEMSGANINNGVSKIYATGCECSKASGDPQQKLPKPDMRGVSWRCWRLEPRVDIDAGALLIQIPRKTQRVNVIGHRNRGLCHLYLPLRPLA